MLDARQRIPGASRDARQLGDAGRKVETGHLARATIISLQRVDHLPRTPQRGCQLGHTDLRLGPKLTKTLPRIIRFHVN